MDIPDRIWELIARRMAGEASEHDLSELQMYMQKDPAVQQMIEQVELNWKLESPVEESDTEQAYIQHMKRLESIQAAKQKQSEIIWNPITGFKQSVRRFFNSGILNNHFKVIYRNLYRFKTFSFINITGLAIGMASAILILLLVFHELSFDQFHEKKDRIYMLLSRKTVNGKMEVDGTPAPLAPILKTAYPQVEEVTRINGTGPIVLSANNKQLEVRGLMVFPGYLKIFSFPLIAGNAENALNSPRSIVLTESCAKRFFGNDDAIGKAIRIDSNSNFIVTGILKDIPSNSSYQFEYLLPWSYMKELGWDTQSWDASVSTAIVLMKPGVTEAMANKMFGNAIRKYSPDKKSEVFVHPLTKWSLWSRFENGKIAGGAIDTVRLYIWLAVFILLIACINYMNLSTARSVKRGKEVGIRKVVGAARASIIWRFMGESVLLALFSLVVCLVLMQLGIKGFNWITSNSLVVPYGNLYFWISVTGFAIFTGLISGSYPAFYLSTFRPALVLKGNFKSSFNLVNIRKGLVILQFSIAITFIICTIIIYRQINYGVNRDPGYSRDHLAFVYVKGDMNKKYALIKQDLLKSNAVTAVTRSNSPICYTWRGDDRYSWNGSNPETKIWISEFQIDNDFMETAGLKLASGRTINTNLYPGDSNSVLLNESAVKIMEFKNPLGQVIRKAGVNRIVVGVVKDFVAGSPLFNTQPMVLQGPVDNFGAISFRLSAQNGLSANMKTVESVFRKYIPDYPILSNFVDEADTKKLEDERKTGVQAAIFAGLAVFISCLGLFGLAAYTAENRIKEIGIRKVLGASVTGITLLLSKEFVKLVTVSFLIASPVAWWLMQGWLQNYTYRVNIGWLVFLITGIITLVIAVLTVGYQAIKSALTNPVNNLRSE